ncbi:hypothetical protein XENTR_v10014548 [Xenopus tropicalis]|nr:hypothetical protein XENTR_v10014548 [Xenopus tropicalis]
MFHICVCLDVCPSLRKRGLSVPQGKREEMCLSFLGRERESKRLVSQSICRVSVCPYPPSIYKRQEHMLKGGSVLSQINLQVCVIGRYTFHMLWNYNSVKISYTFS